MNYKRIYDQICSRAKPRGLTRERGFELHHIYPKSLGGSNDQSNLVKLTYREHFIVHRCLVRFVETKIAKFKMGTALLWLSKSNRGKRSVTSRQFEIARKEFGKYRTEFLNETVGDQTRAEIYSKQGVDKRARNEIVNWWNKDHGYRSCRCVDLAAEFKLNSTNLIKVFEELRWSHKGWILAKNVNKDIRQITSDRMSLSAKNRKR
jgi:hypothetical protein